MLFLRYKFAHTAEVEFAYSTKRENDYNKESKSDLAGDGAVVVAAKCGEKNHNSELFRT